MLNKDIMDLIVNYNLSTEQGYINLRKDYNVDKSPLIYPNDLSIL